MTNAKSDSFYPDVESFEKALKTTKYRGTNRPTEDAVTRKTDDQQMRPSQYNVLVVDDEALMRELLARILSWKGHRCITACNGLEALKKAKEEKIDAVVTDIVMPEMDGIALTKELSGKHHRLPIIILTGHSKDYSEEAALSAGAWEFIRKPFAVDEFILRFHRMMRDYEVLLKPTG